MNKTFIDYLIFRVLSSNPLAIFESMRGFFLAGDCLELEGQGRGKDGWLYRRDVTFAGKLVFTIDHGGDSQRGWARVVLQGGGCGFVGDWRGLAGFIESNGQIRRVDVALDTRDGSVSHKRVIEAHAAGLFKRGVGRPPELTTIEKSSLVDGRSAFVGARVSPVYIRCYEKGWELLVKASFPNQLKKPDLVVDFGDGFGGVRVADYYRTEVELKIEGNRSLPFEILHSPDGYFAAINPFFASLVDASPVVIPRLPNAAETLSLDAGLRQVRVAAGGLLAAAIQVYGDSMESKARLFDLIRASKVSPRWESVARLAEPMARGVCEARPAPAGKPA